MGEEAEREVIAIGGRGMRLQTEREMRGEGKNGERRASERRRLAVGCGLDAARVVAQRWLRVKEMATGMRCARPKEKKKLGRRKKERRNQEEERTERKKNRICVFFFLLFPFFSLFRFCFFY